MREVNSSPLAIYYIVLVAGLSEFAIDLSNIRTTQHNLNFMPVGLPNFWAKFSRLYRMYDFYRAAIIWIWPPIFGESKFGSPFRWKINLQIAMPHRVSRFFLAY